MIGLWITHTITMTTQRCLFPLTGILLGLLLLSPAGVLGQCNRETIKECTLPLQRYNLHIESVFPYLQPRAYTNLCNTYSNVQECLRGFEDSCVEDEKLLFQGVEDAYNYVCSEEGREIYYEQELCWMDGLMYNETRICNETYQDELIASKATAYYIPFEDVQKRQCSALNEYIKCITNRINSVCDKPAADWQLTINKRALGPMADFNNCKISPWALTGGEIAGIVIGCVVFIIGLILFFYCCCNVRAREEREQQSMMRRKPAPKVRKGKPPPPKKEPDIVPLPPPGSPYRKYIPKPKPWKPQHPQYTDEDGGGGDFKFKALQTV